MTTSTTGTKILAVIPARGGSKGLPGKNLRPFAGLPLIAHTIQFAKLCPEIDRCIVSTDSPEIAEVAKRFGADVPFIRPSELAQDEVPMWPVLRHALAQVEQQEDAQYSALLLLDPTSPFRELSDVSGIWRRLQECPSADGVIGVSQPTYNPIWHGVVERDGWMAELFEEGGRFERRQEVPTVFHINGSVYIWRAEFVRKEAQSWRQTGKYLTYEIPDWRAISIDNVEEFERAERLVKGGLIGFSWLDSAQAMRWRSVHQLTDLSGRKVVLTGGAGYVGLAVGEALVELGATVAIVDRDAKACEERAATLSQLQKKGGTVPLGCDLRDEEATRRMIRDAIKKLGGLDILIHCAAYVGTTTVPGWAVPFDQQTVQAWDEAVRVNLTSAFIMVQEARAALEASGHGSVILFGSTYGLVAPDMRLYEDTTMANPAGYGASKGGLLQLTRYLATVLAPKIRVNAVTPGGIHRNEPKIFQQRYVARTPLKRMANEEDMKGAVVYLASDLSAYVTGHNLVIDGGWTTW